MKKMKRVNSLIYGLLCGVVLAIYPQYPEQVEAAQESKKIIVADAATTHHLNLYVAKELGLFKKHHVEVEIINVEDLASARDAVVSGKADVFWACPTLAIAAIANGAPIRTIAQVKVPCTSVLLVPKDSPIREYKDMNDKLIGGISPSCEAVIAITKAAKEAGAKFNLEKLPGGPAIAALKAGRVDGAILEEPHASIAELAGFKVMFREASGVPCRTISASQKALKSKKKALIGMIKAIDEANAIILRDPVASNIVDIAHKYTGAPKDAIIRGNARLRFTIRLKEKGLFSLADDLVEMGVAKKNPGQEMFAPEFKGITWGF
ncbi:MAG: ABC transporter substrate-binding protein [Nitrospirota bacterium]